MAPREANNPYPDQYLTIEYDATALLMPHDAGPGVLNNGETTGDGNLDFTPPALLENALGGNQTTGADETSLDEDDQSAEDGDDVNMAQPPFEVHLPMNNPIPVIFSEDTTIPILQNGNQHQPRANWHIARRNNNRPGAPGHNRLNRQQIGAIMPSGSQSEIDPLAIDMTDPEEDEAWNATHAMFVEAATASFHMNIQSMNRARATTLPLFSRASRQVSSDSIDANSNNSNNRRRRSNTSDSSLRGTLVTPPPGDSQGMNRVFGANHNNTAASGRRRAFHRGSLHSLHSVLDQDPSISDDEQDDANHGGVPELDTTVDTSTATSESSSAPNTPHAHITWDLADAQGIEPITNQPGRFHLSPVRRLVNRERNIFNHQQSTDNINVVTDEDNFSPPYNFDNLATSSLLSDFDSPPSPPRRLNSATSSIHPPTSRTRSVSNTSNTSGRSIHWTAAFVSDNLSDVSSAVHSASSSSLGNTSTQNSNQINFSFGPNTNVADLKYFAERGCIVHLLRALDTPRLKTVGTRMLADYAKMPNRRVAVASNRRILEFCCQTMLELPSADNMGTEWPAREYAVETIRSLTATEDSDSFLMGCPGLLKALAIVVRGGPFYDASNLQIIDPQNPVGYRCDTTVNTGLVSGKARLHACIAIMNLSCGKANKIEIASIPEVLEAMRDVMIAVPEKFSPATSSPPMPNSSSSTATPKSVSEEARLKAATCIKNLSNADANDASLLGADGLVEALAHAAVLTCTEERGATHCTTNACLALMNLSISKANKHKVFKTEGVMDALMKVLARTTPSNERPRSNSNNEARIKACSALSNLAIGYENKIPMFVYNGFVDSILQVIQTDTGEARTKACSILWSFAAEMKNQVPVSYH